MPKALISGLNGQDGSHLADFLLTKGYEVHGIIRRASTFNTARIDHIWEKLHVHHGDLTDSGALSRLVHEVQPDEVYNLGAQSHVQVSFKIPEFTAEATGVSSLRFLEAVKEFAPNARYYQASSSEMFGSSPPPQNERTPFHPRSPYGCAKVFSYYMTVNYREAYGLHASNGILFNHEGPRRGETFVTRKITRAVARIAKGKQSTLTLGNLDAKRDWGYAGDYVEAMWLMLQQPKPDDYVIATAEMHSVREFVALAFKRIGVFDWHKHVIIDPKYFRPAEVDALMGDTTKALMQLNWKPKTSFEELVNMMVDYDLAHV